MKEAFFSTIILISILFTSSAVTAQPGADSLKKTVIKVINLHCNNDMPTIKKRLLNQDGIDDVSFTEIKNEASVFTINYHTSAISQEQIEKAIESTPGCDDQSETPYKVKKEGAAKKKRS